MALLTQLNFRSFSVPLCSISDFHKKQLLGFKK